MTRRYTKVDMLLIRACKHGSFNKAYRRLKSVYRRFYLLGDQSRDEYHANMLLILTDLVDSYMPMTALELVNKLNPQNPMHIGGLVVEYKLRAIHVLTTQIALSPISKLPSNHISPIIIRRRRGTVS